MDSMTLIHAIFLGLLQGLTEFLPVSSSGHLALAEVFLELPLGARDLQGFDIVLHGGSLIALFVCYAALWWKMGRSLLHKDPDSRHLLMLLILASIPAGAAGFFFQDFLAMEFRSFTSLAVQLLLSGGILLLAEQFSPRGHMGTLKPVQALMIGIAQAAALVPGLSRSGLTIAAGRSVGLSRKDAIDFSFLMAFPVIAGATLLTAVEAYSGAIVLPPLSITAAGFLASLVASFVAIWTLRRFALSLSMNWFAAYLILFALALLAYQFRVAALGDPQFIEESIRRYGWIVVFFFALIETMPPLSFFSPGVFALILGGALIGSPLTGVLFVVAATAGFLLGNALFYALGWKYGRKFAHRVHLTEARLATVEHFMKRFGIVSIFLGQAAGAIRPVIAFTAGTVRTAPHIFFPFAFLGGFFFAIFLLGLGFFLKEHLEWVVSIVGAGGTVFVVGAVLVGWFLEHKTRRN